MITVNTLALGIITIAIIAVIVQGNGGVVILNAIGEALKWGSGMINGRGIRGNG